MNINNNNNKNETTNIFRDSPIRYLGYANEVGESFRYQYPKLVIPSYCVASSYCIADALSTGYRSYQNTISIARNNNNNITNNNNKTSSDIIISQTLKDTMDALIWQSVASVCLPGGIINIIVRSCRYSLVQTSSTVILPNSVVRWLPTVVGLGCIPLIVRPIDIFTDYIMDETYRRVFPRDVSIGGE
eukprot:Tbor_TRINITY_DN5101_c4_g1::TRINITY_DN5101_c4_g1_i1::g.25991::m.25991/K17981/MTFP1, MTP18; mitochondrial fission process protein 1